MNNVCAFLTPAKPPALKHLQTKISFLTTPFCFGYYGYYGNCGYYGNYGPGVDFTKMESRAFFIEIALSIQALYLHQTFTPLKASQKIDAVLCTTCPT